MTSVLRASGAGVGLWRRFQPRLLPLTLGVAALTLVAHLGETANGLMGARPAFAEQAKAAPPAAAPTQLAQAAPRPTGAAQPGAASAGATQAGAAQAGAARPAGAAARPVPTNRTEAQLINDMAPRSGSADDRLRQVELRERLLEAAEKRVDAKLAEVRAAEQRLGVARSRQQQEAEERFASLVRMYETMKPKDAARIFEKLDLPVQVAVATRMKTAKIAPVMAAMTPEAARLLTMELAQQSKLAPGTPAPMRSGS